MKTPVPPQPKDFTVGGFRPTGKVRLRVLCFGFAVVEELYEYNDGRFEWKKLRGGWSVAIGDKRQ